MRNKWRNIVMSLGTNVVNYYSVVKIKYILQTIDKQQRQKIELT